MAETIEPTRFIPPSLELTDAAAHKVWEFMEEEKNKDLKLRVYIEGGGCSGFQYAFSFDDAIKPNDTLVKKAIVVDDDGDDGSSGGTVEVVLLIDPMSFQYLVGAKIDYQKDLNGEQFVIHNPNAKTTCGCGSSFSV